MKLLPTLCPALLWLALAGCSRTETTTERTITPEGDTIVSTTRVTKHTGLDSARLGKTGQRIEGAATDLRESAKTGAAKVKEEVKENRERRADTPHDTIVVTKKTRTEQKTTDR